MAGWDGSRPVSATISVRPGCSPDRGCRASGCTSWLPPSRPATGHAVEHGTARAGIGGEFGVRQEVQGHVELLDRTRAGLLLGVERILDTADEEARLVDPSAQTRSATGPNSSPMDFSTFSTDARTCCSRSLKPGRLSPLTWSKWVKMTCSLLALPETAMSLRAATGAACIGWAALSTPATPRRRDLRCPAGCGPEHNVAAGRRACLARQRLKRLRPTNRVRPVQSV